MWIRSPLTAETRDDVGNSWGKFLKWQDRDGRPHQLAIPLALLYKQGGEFVQTLVDQGLSVTRNKKGRGLLGDFTDSGQSRARCVDKLGWHEGCFVLPEETIGSGAEVVVFQPDGGPTRACHPWDGGRVASIGRSPRRGQFPSAVRYISRAGRSTAGPDG